MPQKNIHLHPTGLPFRASPELPCPEMHEVEGKVVESISGCGELPKTRGSTPNKRDMRVSTVKPRLERKTFVASHPKPAATSKRKLSLAQGKLSLGIPKHPLTSASSAHKTYPPQEGPVLHGSKGKPFKSTGEG